MEANCYPAQTRGARMFLLLTVMMVFMAVVQGNTEEVTAAAAPEGSFLCISKCGTCPATCERPPPPILTPQTPSMLYSPPPPSKASSSPPKHAPPPPPTQGQQGSLSNPYYYFYTSEATCGHSFSGLLRLFPMILFFSLSMLLQ